MAGSIFYLAPVENASGKIFGKKQVFVAVRRVWGKRKKGCSVTGERDLVNHPMTEDEMKSYIADHMARHKVPRYIEFVKSFPMNAAGKILKYKMREDAAKKLGLE